MPPTKSKPPARPKAPSRSKPPTKSNPLAKSKPPNKSKPPTKSKSPIRRSLRHNAPMASPDPEGVDNGGPHLLSLPAELRNQIYAEVLVSKDTITYTKDDHKPPGILNVNRQIRAETRPIYYCENRFMLACPDFDPTALLAFRKQSKDLSPTMGRRQAGKVVTSVSLPKGLPRKWSNLRRWAKAMHKDPLLLKFDPGQDWGCKRGNLVLWLAAQLHDLPWARVHRIINSTAGLNGVTWR